MARDALNYYQDLVRLMQSPEGRSFRVTQRPPADYYRWIFPPEEQALGYIVNAPRRHPGAGFLVLANAAGDPVHFPVVLPDGNWRLIGDGRRVLVEGIPHSEVYAGGGNAEITVPPHTAYILRDGF